MSWRVFRALIDEGSIGIADWQEAVRANPNNPAGALKVALLNIYDQRDMTALERFCECVIGLLGAEHQETSRVTALIAQIGDDQRGQVVAAIEDLLRKHFPETGG